MDSTAITFCMDNELPIIVFDVMRARNIHRALVGEPIGTLVSSKAERGDEARARWLTPARDARRSCSTSATTRCDKAVAHLQEEFGADPHRPGDAGLVEKIKVDVYPVMRRTPGRTPSTSSWSVGRAQPSLRWRGRACSSTCPRSRQRTSGASPRPWNVSDGPAASERCAHAHGCDAMTHDAHDALLS